MAYAHSHGSDQTTRDPIAIPLDELRTLAAAVAEEMKSGEMNAKLRERFITVRAALFQRGIYDPVLVRFDSATAPPVTKEELAEQLAQYGNAG